MDKKQSKKTGKTCTYDITMIKNAPNPEAAKAFRAFLLSPENGLKTLKGMGQHPFIPARVPDEKMAQTPIEKRCLAPAVFKSLFKNR